MKKYIFKIKVRGVWLWCHASHAVQAIVILSKETGEPLEEYCLEWQRPKNLDGSEITDAEYDAIMGLI
jgi:hypothetical protein